MGALRRLTGSTWGATFQRCRTLFTAIIKPAMLYGSEVWSIGKQGKGPSKASLQPLVKLQNAGLRIVAGAFKKILTTLLESETNVPPIELAIQGRAYQYALQLYRLKVGQYIHQVRDQASQLASLRRRGRATPGQSTLNTAKVIIRQPMFSL